MMDKQTKCLILIIAGLILFYLVHKYHSGSCSTVTSETEPEKFDSQLLIDNNVNDIEMFAADEDSQTMGSGSEESQSMGSNSMSSDESYQQKLLSKNSSPTKKTVSFVGDQRGNNPNNNALDVFFNAGNPYSSVTDYVPNNDKGSGGWQSVPKSYSSTKKQTTKDMFNIDNYMPGDQHENWFDSMPESISVKNRHLINITKAVGNNTVGSSLKNPSYDIRGNEACPKFVVSPWLQSSIEPDINIKSWC